MNSAVAGDWIDIHTHLNMLEAAPEQALADAKAAGVSRVITISTEPEDFAGVFAIAEKYFPVVACTQGVHPHEAGKYDDAAEAQIKSAVKAAHVVAVGEIGLDFFYKNSESNVQIAAFRRQMQLAADEKMPVQVHTRDAEPETIEIVEEYKSRVRGVFHCYTGSKDMAKKALDRGWNISFSGILTFKNAADLRETARFVPLDRLHVETDAPFLAPVPHRGEKNRPALVVHTARCLADLKGISLEELCRQCKNNALELFPKLSWS